MEDKMSKHRIFIRRYGFFVLKKGFVLLGQKEKGEKVRF